MYFEWDSAAQPILALNPTCTPRPNEQINIHLNFNIHITTQTIEKKKNLKKKERAKEITILLPV